jgi:hypothetical protein
MPKPKLKTEVLTVRLEPLVKNALRDAAGSERRSLANMLEVMVLDWCQRNEIPARKATTTKKAPG